VPSDEPPPDLITDRYIVRQSPAGVVITFKQPHRGLLLDSIDAAVLAYAVRNCAADVQRARREAGG